MTYKTKITTILIVAFLSGFLAHMFVSPPRSFNRIVSTEERVWGKYPPGCPTGYFGDGLADDPCRKTFEWSHDPNESKACYPPESCPGGVAR